ncbi:unnamed protein product [Phyllotreta striolata]|uniref:RanBD1 domain-containing protein n=1 Tax=Phyllotreta striolata TaxID=444603 RepID=A0A9N9XMJ6_PHYSR|nr:unnamed protein product [Phyllotreta striolata]
MRREQVLKVCLNHALDRNVEYVPKDERSFVFGVADFSEGEMAKERLCLRFKNAEVAGEFKRAVDEAVGNCTASADASFRSTDDDDVIVVSETQVTPEEEKFAKSLGLPAKFLAYKQLPDCACAQCKKDDEYLKELFASDSKPAQSSTTTPGKSSFALKPPTLAQPKSTPETTPATAPPPKFSFSSPNMAAFGTTATTVIPFGSSGSNASSGSFGTPLSSTGNSLASPAPSAGSSLFGTPVSSTTSLFGTNSNRIFGNGAPPTGGSIFGGGTTYNSPNTTTAAATAVGSTTNLFGSNSTTSNTGLFGGTTFNSPSTTTAAATTVGSTTNLFGSNSTTSNSGIFGTTFNSPSTTTAAATTVGSTTNLFGSSSTTSNTGIFGGTAFNSPSTTTVGSTANLFGSSSTSSNTSIFGGTNFSFAPPSKPFQPATTTGTGLFGGVSKSSSTVATSDGADANEIVLKCDTNLSFSSLASNVKIDAKPSFTMKTVTDETFSFLGAGAPVFQSTAGKGTANGKDDEGDDEGGTNDDYDPHYEPIVPLPEQIVVTTGEEDEDALFNDRAKLFRYVADTKEWKERGVGQLKVLYHREKHTYRLLLRREQVHKLVLNQLVTKDLELKAMTTEKSWMWVGYNFVDDETNLEKLAVRFKKPETALEFRTVVERATEQLRLAETEEKKSHTNESDGEVPVTVSNFGEGHYEGYYEEANKYSEGEEDDDDVEEEEDDEKTIMFVKECTLSERLRDDGEWQEIGKGDLQVYYDPDVFGARIQVNDEYGKVMSVTLIGINTIMESEGNECTWKAREWTTDMQMRNLKATFADESAAQEFHSNYFEGLNYAQQVGLVDESPVQCASDDTDE